MTFQNQLTNSLTDKIIELRDQGYCLLKAHFPTSLINNCRYAFLPIFHKYIEANRHLPNRGANRYFLPMPFEQPCFVPEFFFNNEVLTIIKSVIGNKIVADQWGCDVPTMGSTFQAVHVDYKRPLFTELPDLQLPVYMLVVSFGLNNINQENGAIEIAAGTHNMIREQAFNCVDNGSIKMLPICMNIGDVLIRHPWTLHRGTPNNTDTPRFLVTIRYVRSWYCDDSREVNSIPLTVWKSLSPDQKSMLRFPVSSNDET